VCRQGQFGQVFKATHKQDGQQYCIKKLPLQKEQSTALKEVQLLAQLSHPNVLAYKESFLDRNSLCIVTEYCTVCAI
jgi:NIMA (never in mitosis gene a)-related kinase